MTVSLARAQLPRRVTMTGACFFDTTAMMVPKTSVPARTDRRDDVQCREGCHREGGRAELAPKVPTERITQLCRHTYMSEASCSRRHSGAPRTGDEQAQQEHAEPIRRAALSLQLFRDVLRLWRDDVCLLLTQFAHSRPWGKRKHIIITRLSVDAAHMNTCSVVVSRSHARRRMWRAHSFS